MTSYKNCPFWKRKTKDPKYTKGDCLEYPIISIIDEYFLQRNNTL
jgi:hypothetical protein